MMSSWQFYSKLVQKLITPFAKLLKRDNITLTKNSTRGDLAEIGASYSGWMILKSLFMHHRFAIAQTVEKIFHLI